MKLYVVVAMSIMPIFMAGCIHQQQAVKITPLAPPEEDVQVASTAPPPTTQAPVISPPTIAEAPIEDPNAGKKPQNTTKHPAHKKSAAKSTQVAENATPANVSALGEISSGNSNSGRNDTADAIHATELRLHSITRSLSDQEKKTVQQVKEFLKQAHDALNSGDTDGAHNLIVKANVLLGELTQ